MMELVDTLPDINVQPAEYRRLLGFPRDHVLDGRARELAEWARSWYAEHGRPWVYARQVEQLVVSDNSVTIDGVDFTSPKLRSMLADAQAHDAILVAASAGRELEAEAARQWKNEVPDAYFFLEVYGSAVVEHLITTTGARLCAWAEGRALAVLPHYSPGYAEWSIEQQARLLSLIRRGGRQPLPAELEVLESGMLRPKKSLLAVFGVARQSDRIRRLSELVPCENCSLLNCQYRRAPYRRGLEYASRELPSRMVEDKPAAQEQTDSTPAAAPLEVGARYATSPRALQRWATERLSLDVAQDGTVEALFRYEGSTCSNMGRAIRFHYHVKLGRREQGYPILELLCQPAPGDEGHRYMCRYVQNAEHLMVAIDKEKPLLRQKLNDVLAWQRPTTAPSCYCEPSSRKHKWGLVLETIHYALAQGETAAAREPQPQEALTR